MFEPNFKVWSTMIRDCCLSAKHREAISLFLQKTRSAIGFKPNPEVIAAVFKSCTAVSAIQLGKALHSYAVKNGDISCHNVSKALLNMYAKTRNLGDCRKLFGQLDSSDTVIWNIVLSGFANCRTYDVEAISFFNEMRIAQQPKPSSVTISIILPVCARLGDLDTGKSVHSLVTKSGLDTHTLVGNALVSFYSKCGRATTDARTVFSGIDEKDVVSWNAIIAGFTENKLMDDALGIFREMAKGSTEPNSATIASILPVCAALDENASRSIGREVHAFVLRRTELAADISVCNALLTFYLRTGKMQEVDFLFTRMKSRDLVSWNSVIAGYTSKGELSKALLLFEELVSINMLTLDPVTFVGILPACALLQNLHIGKQIHGYILRRPVLLEDTAVGNALVNMYTKCYETAAALEAFLMISRRDLISWNSVLDSLSETRYHSEFLHLLDWMLREGFKPDAITILSLISFSVSVSRALIVKEIHCYSIKADLIQGDADPKIGNAIIDAYAKCGDVNCASKIFESLSDKRNLVTCNSMISAYVTCGSHVDAHRIFTQMRETDLTTWNLLIRGYTENNCLDEALDLFHEFKAEGMMADEVTIMSLLPLCAQMASVHWLRECHGYLVRNCFEDVQLKGALLDIYAKCGNIRYADKLFQSTERKDLLMFTAMIGGLAMHGMGEEALKIFYDMISLGIKPDQVIFTSMLFACSHAGLVDEGLEIFNSIEEVHGMKPTMEQYACVVDLLARGGQVHDAYSFVTKMPIKANANIWSTLLGACRNHHQVELGRIVADHLFEVEANDVGNYIVLSNLYASEARWDEVLETRKLMRRRDLRKPAGCSWIEVDRRKNVFVAGDFSHPERSIIYSTLLTIDQQIKEKLVS